MQSNQNLDETILPEDKKNEGEDIVILNFAIDVRTKAGQAEKNLYLFASQLGKLKHVPIYNMVELSEKFSNNNELGYIGQIRLAAQADSFKLNPDNFEAMKNLTYFDNMRKDILKADRLIIIGHCANNMTSLSSNNKIETPAARIAKFFPPNDISNKHIDIIACQSTAFGDALANEFFLRMKNEQDKLSKDKFICDGLTLSSKKHIVIPLPSGAKLYFKMTKLGFPKIFTTGKEYRNDILIRENDQVSHKVSNKQDKKDFQNAVEKYKTDKLNTQKSREPENDSVISKDHVPLTTATTSTTSTTAFLTPHLKSNANDLGKNKTNEDSAAKDERAEENKENEEKLEKNNNLSQTKITPKL
jgi:hypothetical protein